MKKIIGHVYNSSLGIVLILTEYCGETVVDTFLNLLF